MRFGTHLAAYFICATAIIGRAVAGSTIDVHPSQVLAPVNVGIMGAGARTTGSTLRSRGCTRRS
jgi:hypothetical protein